MRRVAALALALGLVLLGAAGCAGDDAAGSEGVSVPAPAPEPAPDATIEPEPEPEPEPAPEPDPAAEPEQSDPSTEPTTDPCAYPGDPLCPSTPIEVPPPDLSNW